MDDMRMMPRYRAVDSGMERYGGVYGHEDRVGARGREVDGAIYRGHRCGEDGRCVRDRDDDRYERYERYDRYPRYEPHDGRGWRDEPVRPKLTKWELRRWAENLENEDGTDGPHFEKRMIKERVKHMGHELSGYTEDELCMAANMLYSDYCEVLRPLVAREPEKEADFYIRMAKAFLEDKDAPDGSAKLAMYCFCIANVW